MVPDRTSDSGKGKDSGLLGVFLAILDGAKSTPNLKIFASTNLREKIDPAFSRRMEI
jgi:ATP-dependent 26S proteasome regulatory subunit